MLYKAQVNHDGLQAGQVYELDADDEAYREGAIEAGFLTPERAVLSFTDTLDSAGQDWPADGEATVDLGAPDPE